MDYLENKVSLDELKPIFNHALDRAVFIAEYMYFESDGNFSFYQQFIDSNFDSRKYPLQRDAIELAIVVNYFKIEFLKTIKVILDSSRQYSIKLLCLDWLFNFADRIPQHEFIELNSYVKRKTGNLLLLMQASLNLLLLRENDQLINDLWIILKKSNDPAVFYRFKNAYASFSEKVKSETLKKFLAIVSATSFLSESQKEELTTTQY